MPSMGSVMKRKKLSDITNTVSSAKRGRSGTQFQENSKEVSCASTKDYIAQLMEENTVLLKALGERNKIIELSSLELQKLRFTLEKANQQNQQLAQANSQMLAELSSSKERLKALQHELGCTVAVLRLKTSELDEKEKLNKELCEKIRVEEERSKCVEVATDASQYHSVSYNMACKLDRNSELNEKEKLNKELCEKIEAEEHYKCTEVAADASQSHSVSNNMTCKPDKKPTLRTLVSTTLIHQVEAKEKDDRIRKSSRRRSRNLKSEPCESKDHLFEIVDAEIPPCLLISEPLHNDNPVQLDSSASSSSNASTKRGKDEAQKDQSASPQCHNQESQRPSVGRPMRKAAEKVSSYKELPLNVKMRRSE